MKRFLAFISAVALASTVHGADVLNDPFTYANGPLTNVASGFWNYLSGNGGALTLNVVNQRAFIDQNDGAAGRDDYFRTLSTTFDPTTDNTSKIYVSFTVNFSSLPFNTGSSTAGSYFAHLKSSAANEFYARIGANQIGAASGKFRLGISNEGWSTTTATNFALDLDLNTDYLVVTLFDLATDRTTLWVDQTDETGTSVTVTDPINYSAGGLINAFSLRQGTSGSTGGPGELSVDNLQVGTTFADVAPEPGGLSILAFFGLLTLLRRIRRG